MINAFSISAIWLLGISLCIKSKKAQNILQVIVQTKVINKVAVTLNFSFIF